MEREIVVPAENLCDRAIAEQTNTFYAIFDISNIHMTYLMQDALRQFKADFFQALAHPTRIAIVEQLRDGELSAGRSDGAAGN